MATCHACEVNESHFAQAFPLSTLQTESEVASLILLTIRWATRCSERSPGNEWRYRNWPPIHAGRNRSAYTAFYLNIHMLYYTLTLRKAPANPADAVFRCVGVFRLGPMWARRRFNAPTEYQPRSRWLRITEDCRMQYYKASWRCRDFAVGDEFGTRNEEGPLIT